MGASLQPDGVTSCVVSSSSFSGQTTLTTAGIWYSCGSIALPSSGLWRLTYQARTGCNNLNGFIYCTISTSSSIANEVATRRMLVERVQQYNSNLNLGSTTEWYIDVATGNTGGATIYLLAGATGTYGSAFMQDDTNGQTGIFATKVRESTTSGTGVTNAGF